MRSVLIHIVLLLSTSVASAQSDFGYGDYRIKEGPCLSEQERLEIRTALEKSRRRLMTEDKLQPNLSAIALFDWPHRAAPSLTVVAENLALHGTVFGWLISDPDVGGGVTGTASGDLDMTAVGGGITYVSSASAGERDHSGGFFLRLAAGGGVADTENSGLPLDFSGLGGELDIAIGGVVAENLALHGTVFGWLISDPDVEGEVITSDSKRRSISGTASGDLDMTAVGGGITYYFMPVNIYLSGSVGVGSLNGGGDISGESDNGFAGMVTAGKEWWVSNRWGLGVAGVFGFHSFPEPGVRENWSGWNLAVMFSATFN